MACWKGKSELQGAADHVLPTTGDDEELQVGVLSLLRSDNRL
jgi:hypothetical protein